MNAVCSATGTEKYNVLLDWDGDIQCTILPSQSEKTYVETAAEIRFCYDIV